MAASRNNGAKSQPTSGDLVVAPVRRPATVPDQLTVFTPEDFKSKSRTQAVLTTLFNQCQANEAAAAIIPWFCDKLRSPRSRRDYHDDMRKFFGHLAAQGVHPYQVTGDHLRLYKEALEQDGKSPGTIARNLSVIRGTYEQFGKKGLVPWNLVGDIQSVTAPPVQKNTTPALDEKDACRLLHAPDQNTMIGCRDHALLFVYFKTWCRATPIANATIGSLEYSSTDWYIHVIEKGRKKRRLRLLEAAPAVLSWIEMSGRSLEDTDAPLFPAMGPDKKTITDNHLTRRSILRVVNRHAKAIGMNPNPVGRRGICTHTLRKTAGNSALEHGAQVQQVQAQFGHSDIRTTQTYVVYTDKDAEAAARRSQIR